MSWTLDLGRDSVETLLNQKKLFVEDWKAIYKFAQMQTVVGIMLVGIHKLSDDLLPPDEILDDWTSDGFFIHQANIKMNKMCAKVTRMFMDRGLHPIILKGQANASWWTIFCFYGIAPQKHESVFLKN